VQGWVPDVSTFGSRLALVRQRMGWGNVKEAAMACGQPVSSWRNWERDGRMPRDYISVCQAVSRVTGVDVNWLAGLPQNATGPTPGIRATGGGTTFLAPAAGLEPATCRLTILDEPDRECYPDAA
jgi:hypothetical protein